MTTANSYDEVPYSTRPYYACHPDCFAVMAVLLGMSPAPPERCRTLEIGCASAGNLIPMALQYPHSQFVGLDMSPVQIAAGQEIVRDLGIKNLDLRAMSVMDVDASWGQFDYVICHGVFSWVPDFVRAKILAICQEQLAPQGIAYVSYNTYPGWFSRKTLRDVLNYHVRRFPDPAQKVSQAREFLEFLDKSGLPTDSPAAQSLRGLIADLRDEADYYLFHEYLEADNQPFYFSEFMAAAQTRRLQYLGNAWHHIDLDLLPKAKQTLLDISEDIVQLEQFTDFLTNRPFRRTLLCHEAVSLDREPPPSVLSRLHARALAKPESPRPDCYSDAPESFVVQGKARGSTDLPLTKTLFTFLAEIYPSTISFDALWREISSRLAAHGRLDPELAEHGRDYLAQTMLRAYLGNFLSLHTGPFPFTTTPGSRPCASKLARWQVARQLDDLSTLSHAVFKPTPLDRVLLRLLDGSRSLDRIQGEFADLVRDGKLTFDGPDGQPLAGSPLYAAIAQAIDDSLARLASNCLLEA